MYNKSQILISHVLAFHALLRVSPHCSSIVLKWLSGKAGMELIWVGHFLFTDLLLSCLVIAAICSCFKQPAKLHSGAWLRARQDPWYCNSEFLLVGRSGGQEAAVDGRVRGSGIEILTHNP